MGKFVLFIKKINHLTGGKQKFRPLFPYCNYIPIIIIALINCISSTTYGQKEYNYWHFGFNAGITFNTGQPVAINSSSMFTGEGCATISDKNGNLLFYTSGWKVYNRINAIMTNGIGLLGNSTSTQSALIIQRPGCKNIFYIFTVFYEGQGGLYYSIVDLEKNNGLGEVIVKNVKLANAVTEKLTAIRHANGVDLWIIAHEWNTNAYLSFLLTHEGVTNTIVKSNIGLVYTNTQVQNAIGYLKSAPNGKILCDVNQGLGTCQISKFNNSTGSITNSFNFLDNFSDSIWHNGPYGLEFSSNGKYFYTKCNYTQKIYQYCISILDSASVFNSKCMIGKSRIGTAMQLAPNGKIYVVNDLSSYLGSIEKPNLNKLQCEFIDSTVYLGGKNGAGGLPNNPFTAPYIQYEGCYIGNYSFHLTDTSSFIQWDFGDPTYPNNTAMGNDPIHVYSQAGTYIIKAVYLTDWNTYDTAISTVWAIPKPSLFLTDTIKSCGMQNVQLKADSIFDHYLWNTGDSVKDITVNEPGWYTVTASDCSCSLADSVFVWSPEIQAPQDVSVCPGIDLVLSANYPGATYLWNTGSVQPILPVTEAGLYWVDIQADSCHIRDSCNVIFVPLTLNLGNDKVICDGQSVYLDASGMFDSLVWWDGQTITSKVITDPGTYTAIAYSQECSMADSIHVKICSEIFFPNIITPNDDGKNDVFRPVFKAVEQYHLLVFNRWGRVLFESNDPTLGWDGMHKGSPCPPGTYYFTASYLSQSITSRSTEQMSGAFMLLR